MTRQFNQRFACSNCGCEMTAETSFGRWIRENKNLDSAENGICIYDIDYIVHKFKTHYGKTFQLMMLVEVKTRNSSMTDAQRDTLYMLSQLTQNRTLNKNMRDILIDGTQMISTSFQTAQRLFTRISITGL